MASKEATKKFINIRPRRLELGKENVPTPTLLKGAATFAATEGHGHLPHRGGLDAVSRRRSAEFGGVLNVNERRASAEFGEMLKPKEERMSPEFGGSEHNGRMSLEFAGPLTTVQEEVKPNFEVGVKIGSPEPVSVIERIPKITFSEEVKYVFVDDLRFEYFKNIEDKSTREIFMAKNPAPPEPELQNIRRKSQRFQSTEDLESSLSLPVASKAPAELRRNVDAEGKLDPAMSGLDVWYNYLQEPDNHDRVASVDFFSHAPMSSSWGILSRMNVETMFEMPISSSTNGLYWICTVKKLVGYYALIEWYHFGLEAIPDLKWINFWNGDPKILGSAKRSEGFQYYPPRDVQDKRLSDPDFNSRVHWEMKKLLEKGFCIETNPPTMIGSGWKVGTVVEALDHTNRSQMRLGKVMQIVEDRMEVQYFNESEPASWWFSVYSHNIQPLGWTKAIGHTILEADLPQTSVRVRVEPYYGASLDGLKLKVGHVFEGINPNRPDQISAASVHRILNNGYFIALFETEGTPSYICFHISSPYIFHCGFAAEHGIELVQPYERRRMTPKHYAYFIGNNAAPTFLFGIEANSSRFKVGMALELADFSAPNRIVPGTIHSIADHMLLIKFNGLEVNQAWFPYDSPDIFPVGYAEVFGYKLYAAEAVKLMEDQEFKKGSTRSGNRRGGKKGGQKGGILLRDW